MKTMNTMKSIALAAMMMMTAMTASAATNTKGKNDKAPAPVVVINQHGHGTPGAVIGNGRGHMQPQPMMRECNCRDCKKARKALDKHMRKHHTGKQNRMACRTCMEYSHLLNHHMEMVNAPHNHRH